MTSLRTSYDFTLPRGYVGDDGRVHKKGTMRLATARDELEPLRHPSVTGPDDPRLTILVLARVVESLGDLAQVTSHEIEGLFAVDLAFLQDFYGVINFGSQEEYDALINAQQSTPLMGSSTPPPSPSTSAQPADDAPAPTQEETTPSAQSTPPRTALRTAVEELPRRAL